MGPVLALLVGTQAECERIIARARQDAATRELAARRMPALASRAVDAIRRLEADER